MRCVSDSTLACVVLLFLTGLWVATQPGSLPINTPLKKWAIGHTNETLRSVRANVMCAEVEDGIATLAKQDMEWKLALVHVTPNRNVLVRSGLVDEFTRVYVHALARKLERALQTDACQSDAPTRRCSRSGGCRPITFMVASSDFAEQVTHSDQAAWQKAQIPLFSSCMTAQTAAEGGVFIPRPYEKKEVLQWHDGFADPAQALERLWARKRGAVVFRGSLSSADRAKLALAVAAAPVSEQHLLNVSVMNVPEGAPCWDDRSRWCPGGPAEWVKQMQVPIAGAEARLEMADQVRDFRYIMSVDGVGCADRLSALMASPSAIVLQESPYREFWYDDLQPGVHYLPVDRNFKNLTVAVASAEADGGAAARRVVLAANAYTRQYATADAELCYLETLVEGYARKLHGPCTPPPGALPYEQWARLLDGVHGRFQAAVADGADRDEATRRFRPRF
jgi:hypothetical protein